LSRREFMKTAAAAALAAGATGCTGQRSPWRFLRVHEARTLAAVCNCIIPPDSEPGAEWAQVVNYIDAQLCGPLLHLRDIYRKGIASLESTSRQQFNQPFANLSSGEQARILADLEQGNASNLWSGVEPKRFFETVLDHTMQGYYGDPRHGGNRERVSWKMLGLPYPQVRGRARLEAAGRR
jgi:gluconate 2-dehydrogenase gamma chain